MKRRDALKTLAGLATIAGLGPSRRARAQDPAEDTSLPDLIKSFGPMMRTIPIEVANLAPGFSLITGPGGNITTLAGPDGLVMVDSFVPDRAAELAPIARGRGAGPITLINTHWHFDHTGGNAALAAIGARIVAHRSVRDRMSTDQHVADFEMTFPASPAAALPVVTLNDSATLFLNGEEIALTHVAPAHTNGDLFVHYRKANVLQTGDLFTNGSYPNIDSSSGGWIGGMIAASDLLLGIVDAKTRIIPGHGPLATRDDLIAARSMLAEARDKIAPLVEAGKTVDQAVAARPLASLDPRWARGLFKNSHFTRVVYSGLVAHRGKN